MNCSSKNTLYYYNGQAKTMTVHRQQTRNPHLRMLPLSNHLDNCSKNKTKHFLVIPFYKLQEDANEIQTT